VGLVWCVCECVCAIVCVLGLTITFMGLAYDAATTKGAKLVEQVRILCALNYVSLQIELQSVIPFASPSKREHM